MKRNYKLIKNGLLGTIIATSLTACIPTVDCDIKETHVHLYTNSNNVSMFIEGEKERKNDFYWTEKYVLKDERINTIIENNLCSIIDNYDYVNDIMDKHPNRRETYVYDYFYGTYTAYDYGYHFDYSSGEYTYGYGYGLFTGYHYDYRWVNISLDEYTTDKVKDITYMYKFYKIDDEKVTEKYFSSLNDIEEGYTYFKLNDFVKENVSEPYYLSENKVK